MKLFSETLFDIFSAVRRNIATASAVCLAIGVACLVPAAQGATLQTYITTSTPTTLVNPPTSIAASTTATNTEIIDVSRTQLISIQVSANNVSTNAAAALTIPIHRSIDGVTFETTATTTLSLTLDGALTRCIFTNMTTGGARAIKFNTYVNGTTNIVTNVVVKVGAASALVVPVPLTYVN